MELIAFVYSKIRKGDKNTRLLKYELKNSNILLFVLIDTVD